MSPLSQWIVPRLWPQMALVKISRSQKTTKSPKEKKRADRDGQWLKGDGVRVIRMGNVCAWNYQRTRLINKNIWNIVKYVPT